MLGKTKHMTHLANTLAETPPAYGRQKIRIFIETGAGEIHVELSLVGPWSALEAVPVAVI